MRSTVMTLTRVTSERVVYLGRLVLVSSDTIRYETLFQRALESRHESA